MRISSGCASLFAHPAVDDGFEDVEGDRPRAEEDVVEGLDVEAISQAILRPPAQFGVAELADLVRQRLPRPGDVAVDLVDDVMQRTGGVTLK